MKVVIQSVEIIDKSHVNITFQILKNDGSLLIQVNKRGFVSLATTQADVRADIIQSFKNIRDSYIAEQASKLSDTVQGAVGSEIDIN